MRTLKFFHHHPSLAELPIRKLVLYEMLQAIFPTDFEHFSLDDLLEFTSGFESNQTHAKLIEIYRDYFLRIKDQHHDSKYALAFDQLDDNELIKYLKHIRLATSQSTQDIALTHKEFQQCFIAGCKRGKIKLAQMLYHQLSNKQQQQLLNTHFHDLFYTVCKHGHIKMALWLEQKRSHHKHATGPQAWTIYCSAYLASISSGHLALVQYLYPRIITDLSLPGTHPLSKHMATDQWTYHCLFEACCHGQVTTATWLVDQMPQAVQMPLLLKAQHDAAIFKSVVTQGHWEMKEWLYYDIGSATQRKQIDQLVPFVTTFLAQ